MLQDHRKSRSRSFLREVEFSTISIKNNEVKNRFLNQFNSINEKRKNPNTIKTGEKYTKTELLTYLKQRGEIKTANIWARSLSYDSNDIKRRRRVSGISLTESLTIAIFSTPPKILYLKTLMNLQPQRQQEKS